MKLTVNYRDVIGGVPADVQVLVEETKADGTTFQDALYYMTIAAHDAAVADGSRAARAQQRIDGWMAATNPKPADEVTITASISSPDEVQREAAKQSLRQTIDALTAQIEAL